MKIGIITFNGAHNYGAQIQAYALQSYLKQQGHDVKVINYRLNEIAKSYRLIKHKKRKNFIKDKMILSYEVLRLVLKENYKFKKKKNFEYFINNVLNVTDKYTTLKELQEANLDFDVLISGSDQVWNYNLTKGIKPAFFLEFGKENTTRISYAASLGIEEIPIEYEDVYARYLKNLDFISVREESARNLLQPLTNKKVNVVLDPTFLVSKNIYDEILVKPKYKKPYIYMHMLVEDQRLIDLVKNASKKLGLAVVHNKPQKFFDNELDHAIATGPKDFLGLIENAEYVFTNSFHATALSIIYHKNFITVPHQKYPTRMQNLLEKLDLTDHLIGEYDDKVDVSKMKINFKNVDKKLEIERKKSQDFLNSSLIKKAYHKSSYFEERDRFSCYGCTACKEICPKGAITMKEDNEGFIYPVIDPEKCIKCGLCEKTCIYSKIKLFNELKNQKVYAAKAVSDDVRFNSTSGGVFTGLYNYVIKNGGYVVGVKMKDKRAVYDITNDLEVCKQFRGAKYVRADIDDIFSKVKEKLNQNKLVLFSGTPCVVAGLKSYLNKDYANLYLVDIVCHSNSSPKVLENYLKNLEDKYGSKIKNLKFRDKEVGWRDSAVKIEFKNKEVLKQSVYLNNYTANFLLGNMSRPCCYNCEFSSLKRVSDITIGDYWGINENYNMDDKKGTSLVLINSEKGNDIFNNIKEEYDYVETSQNEALIKNHSAPITLSPTRYKFYSEYDEKNQAEVLKKYNTRVKKAYMRFGNVMPIFSKKGNYNKITAICLYKFNFQGLKISDFYFKIGKEIYKPRFLFKKGIPLIKGYHMNFYRVSFKISKLLKNDIQNKVLICAEKDKEELSTGIGYDLLNLNKGKNRNSKIWTDDRTNTSWYFRQSAKNAIYLTIREKNSSDDKKLQRKLLLAKILSYIYPKSNMILLFEKESSKYEESASVLYEELINRGYNNVYFIFDKNNSNLYKIDDRYKKNIINKGSLKHYIYFFKAKTFIGTESLAHSIDLRIANRFAVAKIHSKKISYVFLQHGVMYMISLDADLRKHFNREDKKLYRVVVSSDLEAQHFIDLGGYDKEDLYLTGLPKYDRNKWNKNADKIVVMLTWRRWEYNIIRDNVEESNYYKMLNRIVDCIPNEYKDKLIILPHPLFLSIIQKTDFELKKYIPSSFTYDDILKDTKLLITDYSSISYDAFYRGSNVIFYWEEKDECLEKYGPSTKLMLNHDNSFGDIAYNQDELKPLIKPNYSKSQKKKYIDKYSKIVEFHDGKNTERLINYLIKDKIIKERK